MGIGKAVILVEDHSLDLGGATFPLQSLVKGNGQVSKGRHRVVRQADTWLEEYPQHIERGGEIEVEHFGGIVRKL